MRTVSFITAFGAVREQNIKCDNRDLIFIIINMHKYDYIGSALKVTVPEYKESKIEGSTVFFVIQVNNKQNKWTLEKRFSEFDGLVKALSVNYHTIPKLPNKSYLFKMNEKDLENRRKGLEEFLQNIVIRNDLLNSEPVKQFLQLDKNASSSIVNPPKLVEEFLIDGTSKGINDFVYYRQDEVFYLATADQNPISRLGAYLSNSKMPWEKEQQSNKILMEVGSVEAWSRNGDTFVKRWGKYYPEQAICIEYNVAGERVLVGLDDGILDVLKVTPMAFQDLACSKIHQGRITGVYYDNVNSLIYTVSEDKVLRISEGTTLMLIIGIPHRESLYGLVADKINKRLFISGKSGEIYIYDISAKNTAKLLTTLVTKKRGPIKSMQLDLNRNYLFTSGYQDGQLAVFDLDKPNREKYAKQVASLQGKQNVRSIAWIASKSQLIVGTADGSITFWNAVKGKSIYVLQSNQGEISKLHYIPETNTLITATKSKNVKFWTVPKEWRDPHLEAQEQKQAEQFRNENNKGKVIEAVRKAELDSDDDDLIGWHLD